MKKSIRFLDRALLLVGLTLLAIYGAVRIYSGVSSRAALQKFAAAGSKAGGPGAPDAKSAAGGVDFSLWSDKRVAAYRKALGLEFEDPVAVIRIPSLQLEVPVFDGTDELILNRGVGRIIGTAGFGQPGNIGIAGHRDGFFRCLKDIRIGDRIEVTTHGQKTAYDVESIEVVTPDNVSVLQPRERPAITLVTCYPFYFVGDAPRRYIVRAMIGDSCQAAASAGASNTSLH